ncbi:MAG: hypothetical protein PHV06_09675 [bacterium]|nr:hypothetical protein [bacterium]
MAEKKENTPTKEFFDRFSYRFRLVQLPGDIGLVDLKGNLNDFLILEILFRCIRKLRYEQDFYLEVPDTEFWKGIDESIRHIIEIRILGQCIEVIYLSRKAGVIISNILLSSIFLQAKHKLESIIEMNFQREAEGIRSRSSGKQDG